ncbi:hypothetical protein MMPV_006844 [Pyropia vietnamensis]
MSATFHPMAPALQRPARLPARSHITVRRRRSTVGVPAAGVRTRPASLGWRRRLLANGTRIMALAAGPAGVPPATTARGGFRYDADDGVGGAGDEDDGEAVMEDYIPQEDPIDGGDANGDGRRRARSTLEERLAAAEAEAAAALAAGIPPLLAGMDIATMGGVEFDATDEDDEDDQDLPPWDESVPALNSVFLTGRAGKDPVIRNFPSGARLVSFTLAVPRDNFAQAAAEFGGSPATWRTVTSTTDWFDVDAWGRLGERVEAVVRKGARVVVAGELDIQEWVDAATGELRSRPLIVLSEVEALDGRGGEGG